ncbi:MAG TPA: hypothetical protein VD816_02395 [Ohtaekwangia sp.]|nr:hypothetical protein [Ohtaekwangia sp.]
MKTSAILLTAALAIAGKNYAQTLINRSIPVPAGQKIAMHFDYPELIRVSTWDKNEISIQGTVSINNGENDDAFELQTAASGNTTTIRNEIKNMKSLPQRITVFRDGQKMIFRDNAALSEYQQKNGKAFDVQSWGVDMDIVLEIKVPRNAETHIESVYGLVEIKDFTGPLNAVSTYGGVDAALSEKLTGEVIAETNYGDIYTNFDAKFGGLPSHDDHFHTYVSVKPGNGPKYRFESKYGNVYVRKAN